MTQLLKVEKKDLSPAEFRLFRDFIQGRTGIFIEENRLDSLRISLLARVTKNKFRDYIEYYDFIRFSPEGKDEFNELLNLITINETTFFRNPAQFKALQEVVLPEIINKKIQLNDKNLRIWAAGCSSGEEPYTIAMVILNTHFDHQNWKINILGTDVSTRVLELARKGIYRERDLRFVDNHSRQLFFEKTGKDNYAVKDNVKELVEFKYFNLIETPYPLSEMKNWDIIFCRNVTIYFKLESTKRVINNFYNSLAEGGYLFIGHAESLTQISDEFTLVEAKDAFFYRRGKARKKEIKEKIEKKIEEKKYPLAVASHEDFKNRIRNRASVLLKKAEKFSDEGETESAIRMCLEAESTDPLYLEPYFFLGIIYKDTGNISDAIIQFKKVLYINPHYFLAHYYLGNIYRKIGEHQKALTSYVNVLQYIKKSDNSEVQNKFDGGFNHQAIIQSCEKNIKEIGEELKNV